MNKIIGLTKLSGKNITVVPKEVRKKLGLKIGDRILWIEEKGKIYVTKA